jgi:HEAT repeat protein
MLIEETRQLGAAKDTQALPLLISLLNDDDQELVWMAARSIANIGSRRATRPLLRCARATSKVHARLGVIYALKMLEDKRAVSYLIQILGDQNEHEVLRDEAADALSAFPSARTLSALVRASTDKSAAVRLSVAYSLGSFREEAAEEVLQALLHDESRPTGGRTVAEQAAESLAILRGRQLPGRKKRNPTSSKPMPV